MPKARFEESEVEIEKLRPEHAPLFDRFISDSVDENSFLRDDALAGQMFRLSDTYLLVEKKTRRIVSYISLYIGSFKLSRKRTFHKVKIKDKPYSVKRLRHMPCLIIGRLATNKEDEGKGAATLLIASAIKQAHRINELISFPFLVVHAYKEKIPFYEKKGFKIAFTPSRKARVHTMYVHLFV